MARYVVVEFAENGDADEFISEIAEMSKGTGKGRVVGIFVKPKKVCVCPDWRHTNYGDKNREHGVERGSRFGWWICTRCKRPRRASHQLVNQLLPSATYPGRETEGEYEFVVDSLTVGSLLTKNIPRPKKLRKVAKRWLDGMSSSSSTPST